MVKMSVQYSGQLHCEITHGPSQTKIQTDAPKDNMGRGESFSPTDLVGAALASCILTTIAIVAERDGVSIAGASAEIEKHMVAHPRRIGELPVRVHLPASIPEDYRAKIHATAHACPVGKSLHPDVKVNIDLIYG